jgi:galactosamine-6-phosphate isomerase
MKIETANSYDELSLKAKNLVIGEIEKNKRLLLCTATGSSPTGMYRQLCTEFQANPGLFDQLRIIKLDEWGGVAMDQPGTCEMYLRQNLLQPLQIPESRYTGFNSNPKNPVLECQRIQDRLNAEGPIDLCILGIGLNGHLAFNEPASYLQPFCHVAELSEMTLQHAMASKMNFKPGYGFTLGMADILHSKMILILITGKEKREIVQKFLSKKVSSSVPASFLWIHPNVHCLVTKDALDETI